VNTHTKTLALFVLLFPLYTFGQSKESRIAQLKKASFTQAQKLKELGKQISDSSEFIASLGSKYPLLMEIALHRQIGELNLSDLEKDQLEAEIDKRNSILCDEILYALCENNGLNRSLATELFDQQEMISPYRFDSLKFCYIRAAVEYHLLTQLVEQYEACLQKLLAINKELKFLTKEY
jgi:hypothetical protein